MANDLEYGDLNDEQREKFDATAAALGGGRSRQSRGRSVSKRDLTWDSALGAYRSRGGELFRSNNDGTLRKVRELTSSQRESLTNHQGPSSWKWVRRKYGLDARGE